MQISRVPVNTADPFEVYRLVREHLRGDSLEHAAAAAGPALEGIAGRGLGSMRRATTRGIAQGPDTPPPRRDPAAEGLGFIDRFRNGFVERYWRAAAGTFSETSPLAPLAMRVNSSNALALPRAQLITSADTYLDFEISLNIDNKAVGGTNRIAYLLGRVSSTYPDPLTAYTWEVDLQTGAYQLVRWVSGIGTALAFGAIAAPVTPPATMGMRLQADSFTCSFNGVDLVSKITDAAGVPRGAVGFGTNGATWVLSRFDCTPL